MASSLVTLATELTTLLNAQFSATFTAVRKYAPEDVLEESEDLEVLVMAAGGSRGRAAFGAEETTYDVAVIVRQKLTDYDDPDDIDTLADVAEDIAAYLPGQSITSGSLKYTCTGVTVGGDSGLIDIDEYRQHGVFHSSMTAHFQVF